MRAILPTPNHSLFFSTACILGWPTQYHVDYWVRGKHRDFLSIHEVMRGSRGGDKGTGHYLEFSNYSVKSSFLRWHCLKFIFGPYLEKNWSLVPIWKKILDPPMSNHSNCKWPRKGSNYVLILDIVKDKWQEKTILWFH